MKKTKKRKKIEKGEFGYFKSEKKRRLILTAILLGVPLFIFATMWAYHGTRNTIWTVIAAVGCLPGCKSMVGLIMIWMRKRMDSALYKKIRKHQGDLEMAYEMYMTFYEKSGYLDAFAVCGNTVVGYTSDPAVDTAYMEEHAQNIVRGNGYKVEVKILKDILPFLERLDSMNLHQDSLREGIKFRPDSKYPDLNRDQLVKHTLLALCL